MKRAFTYMASIVALAWSSAWASLVTPVVEGNNLSWPALTASTINIHRGDGSYVESLPGSAIAWTAPEPGDYYLVAADRGHWRDWPRSETVTVQDSSTDGVPMPYVNFIELAWAPVPAISIYDDWRQASGAISGNQSR